MKFFIYLQPANTSLYMFGYPIVFCSLQVTVCILSVFKYVFFMIHSQLNCLWITFCFLRITFILTTTLTLSTFLGVLHSLTMWVMHVLSTFCKYMFFLFLPIDLSSFTNHVRILFMISNFAISTWSLHHHLFYQKTISISSSLFSCNQMELLLLFLVFLCW